MYVSTALPNHTMSASQSLDPDVSLLERVATGDRQALDDLIQRHLADMWKVALRLCNGRAADAEDVVQEACLACLGSAHTYRQRGNVRSWLLAITANAARKQHRNASRRRLHEAQAELPAPPSDSNNDDHALREAARAELTELREPFRVILSLRYLDELDDSAIAATLGLSEVTVRTRCHRALNFLRTALNRRGFAVGTTTVLVAALTPIHASAMPHRLSQLVSTACATGNAITVNTAAGTLGFTFGTKVAASLVAVAVAALLTASFISPEQKPEPTPVPNPQPIAVSEPPADTVPPVTVADTILDQQVTTHLSNLDLDSALALLRISMPLEQRPHFIIGNPKQILDSDLEALALKLSSQKNPNQVDNQSTEFRSRFIDPNPAVSMSGGSGIPRPLASTEQLSERVAKIPRTRDRYSHFRLDDQQAISAAQAAEASKEAARKIKPGLLSKQIALVAEGQSLQQTLDALASAHGLRWWKDGKYILIDKPLPPDELKSLEVAFHNDSSLANARALATSSDCMALRPLLLALADKERSSVAAAMLTAWIEKHTNDTGMAYDFVFADDYNITDLYGRNILTRFAKDPEVIQAVTAAMAEQTLPLDDGIFLAGQLQIPGTLEKCIALAKDIPPPTASDRFGEKPSINKLYRAVIAALKLSGRHEATKPLINIAEKRGSDDRLGTLALYSLCTSNDSNAFDKIQELLQQDSLKHDIVVMKNIFMLLAESTDPRVVPLLSQMLTEKTNTEAYFATLSLSIRGGEDSLNKLIDRINISKGSFDNAPSNCMKGLLRHENKIIEDYLYRTLKAGGPHPLYNLLHDINNYVTIRKSSTLFALFERILLDNSIPKLDKREKKNNNVDVDSSWELATLALIGLDSEKAEKFLFETLPNRSDPRYATYCKALAGLSDRGNEEIIKLSQDPKPRYRILAATFLPQMGEIGQQRLFEIIDHDENENVCKAAFKNLNPTYFFLRDDIDFRLPIPVAQWHKWLAHKFPSIREATVNFISSCPRYFSKDKWITLINSIMSSSEMRNLIHVNYKTLFNLYYGDPTEWRNAVNVFSASSLSDQRVGLWVGAEMIVNDILSLPQKLSDDDKIYLLQTAAKAAASDPDPLVRARAGWMLGNALRRSDVLALANSTQLQSDLLTCAKNETDADAKMMLEKAIGLDPFPTNGFQNDAATFTWPKEDAAKQPAVTPPKPQSADDF